jgi:GT2 family glycosyltransferase
MNEDLIRVALVIPVYNRKTTTLQCLRSLGRVDKQGLQIKIFIVDDGSTDGTSEAIRKEYPSVDLIMGDGTLHYAAGTNRGIEAALKWEPRFVITMNDDAVFHEQFLQRLIQTAQDNPRSIVGALLLLWDEPHRVFQVGQKWKTWRGGWVIPDDLTAFNVGKRSFEVEGLVGNCLLLPVEAIRECGLMDEQNFPHGWGDAQYTARLRKAGWRLLVEPRSLVWCEPNTYPLALHEMAMGRMLEVLFKDRRYPQNLHRQFMARWESGPTKPRAMLAFGVYLAELIIKSIQFSYRSISGRYRAVI